jgi:putative hydrolase of the HAD superfamily
VQHELPEALCFDLDQTLLDGSQFSKAIAGTCEAIGKRVPELNPALLMEANSNVFAKLGPATMDDWTLGRLTGRDLSLEAWRLTLRDCGCVDESVLLFASDTSRRLMRRTYQLYDDAKSLIDAVSHAGIPLALITNGASDTQREKLDAIGILDWFAVLVISGEIGVAKPDVSAFTPVIQQLGIEGKALWHIGDNLETDVAGAEAAGLTSVWLNRRGEPNRHGVIPDIEIVTLTALIEFVAD